VVRYLEFETHQMKKNRDWWAQTPISDHCGVLVVL
jgi:hypothetical protein